ATGNEAKQTKIATDAFLQGVTTESASGLTGLNSKLEDLKAKLADVGPAAQAGKLGFNDIISATSQLDSAIAATKAQIATYQSNVDMLSNKLGISKSAVMAMAGSIDVDLYSALN